MSTRIRLDAITFDAGTQIREAISEQLVTDYAECMTEGDQFPPIVLFHDGNQYYMADGFHRALASQRLKCVDIAADVKAGTKVDALWFALGANRKNGKRLSSTDLRHAILLAFQTWPDRSAREVAAQIGCTDGYVGDIKKQVQATLHLPDRVTGKDGKSYPASTRKNAITPAQADDIAERVRAGESVAGIAAATGLSVSSISNVKSRLGLIAVPKTRAAVDQRKARMREMAAEGHTSRQIAAELGISDDGCRDILHKEGIAVPADRVTRNTRRADANRIVDQMVMDAEHLTADVNLITFADLDGNRLAAWVDSLVASRKALDAFIRQLVKEHKKHGEAA